MPYSSELRKEEDTAQLNNGLTIDGTWVVNYTRGYPQDTLVFSKNGTCVEIAIEGNKNPDGTQKIYKATAVQSNGLISIEVVLGVKNIFVASCTPEGGTGFTAGFSDGGYYTNETTWRKVK